MIQTIISPTNVEPCPLKELLMVKELLWRCCGAAVACRSRSCGFFFTVSKKINSNCSTWLRWKWVPGICVVLENVHANAIYVPGSWGVGIIVACQGDCHMLSERWSLLKSTSYISARYLSFVGPYTVLCINGQSWTNIFFYFHTRYTKFLFLFVALF